MVSRRRDTFTIKRSVDLYWTEKFLVVLQFLQWQALLWVSPRACNALGE